MCNIEEHAVCTIRFVTISYHMHRLATFAVDTVNNYPGAEFELWKNIASSSKIYTYWLVRPKTSQFEIFQLQYHGIVITFKYSTAKVSAIPGDQFSKSFFLFSTFVFFVLWAYTYGRTFPKLNNWNHQTLKQQNIDNGKMEKFRIESIEAFDIKNNYRTDGLKNWKLKP